MHIYILDSDPAKIPELLTDDDLSGMIEGIAQALCNAHHYQINIEERFIHDKYTRVPYGRTEEEHGQIIKNYDKELMPFRTRKKQISLSQKPIKIEWSEWTRHCLANYRYLFELGLACCNEFNFRFNSEHKKRADIHTVTIHPSQAVIEWCSRTSVSLSACWKDDRRVNGWNCMEPSSFPLVMPDEFKSDVCEDTECQAIDTIFAYCIYYAHTLKDKEIRYTRRKIPSWIQQNTAI